MYGEKGRRERQKGLGEGLRRLGRDREGRAGGKEERRKVRRDREEWRRIKGREEETEREEGR